tara:strand:+ start:11735 stop:12100 length:366 start_codon:yes stop_codon:yes gene_type:complete
MNVDDAEMNSYWNKEELLKRVMDNPALVNTLLNVFIEDMPKILINLMLAVEENNFEQVVVEAHNLKGSSYNLTVNQIGDLAKEIEEFGKERNLTKINALLPTLIEQLDNTIDHFKSILTKG